jgi:replicative DNA helicase
MKDQRGTFTPLSDLVKSAASRIENAYHRRTPSNLTYGFHALDEMTGGIHPGDRVAVIAEDADLATALLVSVVHSLVVADGVPTRIVSARHDETYITTRLIGIESGISEIKLRSGMLKPVHVAALTDAASVLHAAPLSIASIVATPVEDVVGEIGEADSGDNGPLVIDGFPAYQDAADRALARLWDTATEQGYPVILSADASSEDWEARRLDRWFNVVLRVQRSAVNDGYGGESIEIEILKNSHGTVGTVYLEYQPRRGFIHDIEAEPITMSDLHVSLQKINARHGETLRRLGEGVQ